MVKTITIMIIKKTLELMVQNNDNVPLKVIGDYSKHANNFTGASDHYILL